MNFLNKLINNWKIIIAIILIIVFAQHYFYNKSYTPMETSRLFINNLAAYQKENNKNIKAFVTNEVMNDIVKDDKLEKIVNLPSYYDRFNDDLNSMSTVYLDRNTAIASLGFYRDNYQEEQYIITLLLSKKKSETWLQKMGLFENDEYNNHWEIIDYYTEDDLIEDDSGFIDLITKESSTPFSLLYYSLYKEGVLREFKHEYYSYSIKDEYKNLKELYKIRKELFNKYIKQLDK